MKSLSSVGYPFIAVTALFCSVIFSCNNNTSKPLSPAETGNVKDSVVLMMGLIAKDISANGPIAWLKYFENTPSFFMAADGQLAFANYDSAVSFINSTLVKHIKTVHLNWGGIRIDSLTQSLAVVGTTYHEDIMGLSSKAMPYNGYFTAMAEHTASGWKLRNVHWSLLAGK